MDDLYRQLSGDAYADSSWEEFMASISQDASLSCWEPIGSPDLLSPTTAVGLEFAEDPVCDTNDSLFGDSEAGVDSTAPLAAEARIESRRSTNTSGDATAAQEDIDLIAELFGDSEPEIGRNESAELPGPAVAPSSHPAPPNLSFGLAPPQRSPVQLPSPFFSFDLNAPCPLLQAEDPGALSDWRDSSIPDARVREASIPNPSVPFESTQVPLIWVYQADSRGVRQPVYEPWMACGCVEMQGCDDRSKRQKHWLTKCTFNPKLPLYACAVGCGFIRSTRYLVTRHEEACQRRRERRERGDPYPIQRGAPAALRNDARSSALQVPSSARNGQSPEYLACQCESMKHCQWVGNRMRHWRLRCPKNPHLEDPKFECDVCGMTCNRKDNLQQHRRRVHHIGPGQFVEGVTHTDGVVAGGPLAEDGDEPGPEEEEPLGTA